MARKNDVLTWNHVTDEKQYYFLKEKLWNFAENEDFTDTQIITDKDINFIKKVHFLILDCFCKKPDLFEVSENGFNSHRTLSLRHETDIIDSIVNLLYFGKCLVPVTMLPDFMDLANHLGISQIFVYDERGSYYFIYLMRHKNKLLNYLCYIKKTNILCDTNIITRDFKSIPVHRSILAAYSNKFFYYYKNRIAIGNPVSVFLPSYFEELEKILEFCYFGQLTYTEPKLSVISVAYLVGVDRLLEKFKKKKNLYDENNYTVIKPPVNTIPEIQEKLKKNSRQYVYLWIERRCYLIPVACFQVLNFNNDCNIIKDIGHDLVVFLKNGHSRIIKRFVYCLYTWAYSVLIDPLIDMFGLKWPDLEEVVSSSGPDPKKIYSEIDRSPLYASNIEDLRTICEKIFEEECSEGEMMIQLFTCQTCGEQLLSKRAFVIHGQKHQNDRYLCEECGKLVCQKYFSLHLKRHAALKNNQCDRCSKQFPSAFGLKRHMVNLSCLFEKCTKCNKRIKTDRMLQHVAYHNATFRCSFCDKNLKSKLYLQRHKLQNQLDKEVKCLYCIKTFTTKCHLKLHMYEHDILFKCSLCGAKYRAEVLLKKHFNRRHVDQQITCTICGKIFTRFSSLKVHERSHTGEKPFNCKVCNKPFGRKDTMYYHMRHVHNPRKYLCPICNKKYTSRNYFLEHGWVSHQQFFDPKIHLVKIITDKDQDELGNLDPDALYEQIIKNTLVLSETPVNGPQSEILEGSKENINYPCPMCSTKFENFRELISHLNSHV